MKAKSEQARETKTEGERGERGGEQEGEFFDRGVGLRVLQPRNLQRLERYRRHACARLGAWA